MKPLPLLTLFRLFRYRYMILVLLLLATLFWGHIVYVWAQVPVGGIGGGNAQTLASGTAVMTTAAIAAAACGTTVTVSATGVATTDTITWAFNAAPGGQNAGLVAWPTAGNVNFAYCSNTAETPAAATINWRVVRP